MNEIKPKEAFDAFKPENCIFVISVDNEGKPNGMIAGWNMKCSIDPPLFAVALSKHGNTHRLIRESKEFVVAIPNKKLEKEVEFFGSCHGNLVDKFKNINIETEKSKFLKSPLIKAATINMECKLFKEMVTGDHYTIIGEVIAAHQNEGEKILFNMGRKDGKRIFKEL